MKIAIFGASGFAREVADICAAIGYGDIVLLNTTNESSITANGLQVLGEQKHGELAEKGYVFAIGVADPMVRELISAKYQHLNFPVLIHPSVIMGIGQFDLLQKSRGSVFAAGTILMNNIHFGDFCVCSLSVTIGHDCTLEDYVSIMPGARLSGNVFVRSKAYIGSSCFVIQGENSHKLEIGSESIIGAGAVVINSVAPGQKVVGNPARKI